jgi:hypothetical protein
MIQAGCLSLLATLTSSSVRALSQIVCQILMQGRNKSCAHHFAQRLAVILGKLQAADELREVDAVDNGLATREQAFRLEGTAEHLDLHSRYRGTT